MSFKPYLGGRKAFKSFVNDKMTAKQSRKIMLIYKKSYNNQGFSVVYFLKAIRKKQKIQCTGNFEGVLRGKLSFASIRSH